MRSCFALFAHGPRFGVDAFLADSSMPATDVWRRGEPLRDDAAHKHSGFRVALGDGRSLPFRAQDRIAAAFLREHEHDLVRLVADPDVDRFGLGLHVRVRHGVVLFQVTPSAVLTAASLHTGVPLEFYVETDPFHGMLGPAARP